MIAEYKSKHPYRNHEDCKIQFKCPHHQRVDFEVPVFDIEYHGSCTYDFVSFNGERKCGLRKKLHIENCNTALSKCNQIEIIFHSDSTVTRNGFKIQLGCKGV